MRTLCCEAARPSAVTSEAATTAAAVSSLDDHGHDANSEIEIEIEIESGELHSLRESVLNAAHLTEALAPTIARLWSTDVAIQSAYHRRHQFQLDESAKYLLDQIVTIASPRYIPSEQDLVHVASSLPSARSVGLHTTSLRLTHESNVRRYELLDMSGVRGARHKWLRCFDGEGVLEGVIFVASLADYDRTVPVSDSNGSTTPCNAMIASLQLFASIVNRRGFCETTMMLLLTHTDRLAEKLFESPLEPYFPEYTGRPGNYDDALTWIRGLYEARIQDGVRTLHVWPLNTHDRAAVAHTFTTMHQVLSIVTHGYGCQGFV